MTIVMHNLFFTTVNFEKTRSHLQLVTGMIVNIFKVLKTQVYTVSFQFFSTNEIINR
jgi:methionine-rich copper-binding protein CopC